MKKVLIVDDEALIRGLLVEVVELAGAEVSEASNGLEAIELINKEEFDVIISDIDMPLLSGLELMAWLQAEESTAKFVLITGRGPGDDVERVCEAYGVKLLLKPFKNEEVIDIITS